MSEVGAQSFLSKGFTLVELLLVMGIVATLLALVTISLVKPQSRSALDATVLILVSDLKQQQMKAMIGQVDTGATASPFGVKFSGQNYTLFQGSSFQSGAVGNFLVTVHPSVQLTTNLPNAELVFSKVSGEVLNFSSSTNTITATSNDGAQQVMTVNRYGVVNY